MVTKKATYIFVLLLLSTVLYAADKKSTSKKTKSSKVPLLQLAREATEKEEYKKAITIYKKALKAGGNPAIIHYNMGNLYYRLNQKDKAIFAYEVVIDYAPNFKDPYMNLGKIYYQIGEYLSSLETFSLLLQKDPNNPKLFMLIGDVNRQMGLTVEAEKYYRKANQNTETTNIYIAIASLYYEIDDHHQVLHIIEEGLKKYPRNQKLTEFKASSLKQMKQYKQTAAIYNILLSDFPDISLDDRYWYQYQLSHALYESKQEFMAFHVLKECVRRYPQKTEAFDYLISLYVKKDRDYDIINFLIDFYTRNKIKTYVTIKDFMIRAYNRDNTALMRHIIDNFYDRHKVKDQLYYKVLEAINQ